MLGLLMMFIGACLVLFCAYDMATLAPPNVGTSTFRASLSSLCIGLFGVPAGYVAYSLIWGVSGGMLVWLGWKVFLHE